MRTDKISFGDMVCNWKGKRHVSDATNAVWLLVAIIVACSCCYTSISFMRDLGVTDDAKDTLTLFAVAADLSLFFLVIFCLPKGWSKPIQAIAILCAFTVSMFSIGSYFVSQQWANDHQGAIQTTNYTKYLSATAPDSKASLASHAAYRDRMERALTAQRSITSTPQTAIYDYVAKQLGVAKETVVLWFRLFCAFTLLICAVAIKSFRQHFFTTKELQTHVKNFKSLQALHGGQVGLNSPTLEPVIHNDEAATHKESQQKKFHVEHPVV